MWTVFRAERLGDVDRGAVCGQVAGLFREWTSRDIVVRGAYDVAGLRADADVTLWLHRSAGTLAELIADLP